LMSDGNTKYIQDLRMNVKSIFKTESFSEKESLLIALSIAVNEKNKILVESFRIKLKAIEVEEKEIAEACATASLLSVNNVLYRFRHFMEDDDYHKTPAKIRMNIMLRPELGKELFEIISLAVSAVNGCQACVVSHEHSLIEMGVSKSKIFDAIRIASIIRGLSQVIS
jgi:alkyl hydroperoxide reductase subunit D